MRFAAAALALACRSVVALAQYSHSMRAPSVGAVMPCTVGRGAGQAYEAGVRCKRGDCAGCGDRLSIDLQAARHQLTSARRGARHCGAHLHAADGIQPHRFELTA